MVHAITIKIIRDNLHSLARPIITCCLLSCQEFLLNFSSSASCSWCILRISSIFLLSAPWTSLSVSSSSRFCCWRSEISCSNLPRSLSNSRFVSSRDSLRSSIRSFDLISSFSLAQACWAVLKASSFCLITCTISFSFSLCNCSRRHVSSFIFSLWSFDLKSASIVAAFLCSSSRTCLNSNALSLLRFLECILSCSSSLFRWTILLLISSILDFDGARLDTFAVVWGVCGGCELARLGSTDFSPSGARFVHDWLLLILVLPFFRLLEFLYLSRFCVFKIHSSITWNYHAFLRS